MNYKRIFTFGCSFTNWTWPTWADIISVQTSIPVYNGGLAGLGNVGISYRILEYDMKYHFQQDDLILVMWTNWSREDRYLNNEWKLVGNVFNNNFYDSAFIEKYWSWENDIIKNASSILFTNKSFQIGENYSAFEYAGVESGKEIRYESDLEQLYVKQLPAPIVFNFGNNCNFNNKSLDGHPDILAHVKFYNENIADKFNFPKVLQESCFHQWQHHLENNLSRKNSELQKAYIKEYFQTKNCSFSKT
jgi:hypothetical protein